MRVNTGTSRVTTISFTEDEIFGFLAARLPKRYKELECDFTLDDNGASFLFQEYDAKETDT